MKENDGNFRKAFTNQTLEKKAEENYGKKESQARREDLLGKKAKLPLRLEKKDSVWPDYPTRLQHSHYFGKDEKPG